MSEPRSNMTPSISYPPSSTVILNSYPVWFCLLTWHTSLVGRGDNITFSIPWSPMHVDNIYVNFLVASGSLINWRQQCKKILTGYSVSSSRLNLRNAFACIAHCSSSRHCSSIDFLLARHNSFCLRTSYKEIFIVRCISSHTYEFPPNIFVSCVAILHWYEPLPTTFVSLVVLLRGSELPPTTFVFPYTLLLRFEPLEVTTDLCTAVLHVPFLLPWLYVHCT
jgi:hypothetical protein